MSHVQAADVVIPQAMDYAAIGVAFLTAFVLSFLWWGPIFGQRWAVLMGMPMDPKNRPSMTMPLLLQAVGTALMAYVLWHVMVAFAVTHDTTGLARGTLTLPMALTGSFFMWLGFIVPIQLGRVAWEGRSWTLYAINAGGHLVVLLAMGLVFALMTG